jgi:hypothetical protein
MIRLRRTFYHGWYIFELELHHNRMMADTTGEKMHWKCHYNVDPSLRLLIGHMRGKNIPLNQVYGVMCDMHGGAANLPFRK